MSDCQILDDAGNPVDLQTGDIVTSNGGMLGLGHAGLVARRGNDVIVIEVMLAPDGSVHVQERDICKFLDDYEAQGREVFLSRVRKPAGESDDNWRRKLARVAGYMKERVCTRYPVWGFGLDVLFHLPDVWYCSDLVREAFHSEGIEIEVTVPIRDASDDADTQRFLFSLEGEAQRRFGRDLGGKFLRGGGFPKGFADPEARETPGSDRAYSSLDELVAEAAWRRQLERMGATIDHAFDGFARRVANDE